MKIRKYLHFIISILAVAVLIVIDHIIKILVSNFLPFQEPITIIPGVLNLTYITNDGAAFGMFAGNIILLIILPVIVLGIGIFLLFKRNIINTTYLTVCTVMILSGGFGNLIDRVFKGSVVDYIDVAFYPFENFAIFNFADCLLVIGTTLLLIYYVIYEPIKNRVTSDQ